MGGGGGRSPVLGHHWGLRLQPVSPKEAKPLAPQASGPRKEKPKAPKAQPTLGDAFAVRGARGSGEAPGWRHPEFAR